MPFTEDQHMIQTLSVALEAGRTGTLVLGITVDQ